MEGHCEVHLPLLPEESLVTVYAQQRPRRSGGYRIEMENIGKKIVVHNYGHGGAGVSLAPGSAIEAVSIANKSLQNVGSVAVIGSGVIGLFTCRELLKQFPGVKVQVYASRLPCFGEKENEKLITSQVAPGLWFPFHYGREKDPANQRVACLSFRAYQAMAQQEEYRDVVRGVEVFDLTDSKHMQQDYNSDPFPQISDSYTCEEVTISLNGKIAIPCSKLRTFKIDMQPFLNALMGELRAKGVHFSLATIDQQAISELPHSVVFNCSGLGSRVLFKDQQMKGMKGHLLEYHNPDSLKYNCFISANVGNQFVDYYMHGSRILVGFTEEDTDNCKVEPAQVRMLQEAHRAVLQKFGLASLSAKL